LRDPGVAIGAELDGEVYTRGSGFAPGWYVPSFPGGRTYAIKESHQELVGTEILGSKKRMKALQVVAYWNVYKT
jgi:hypothetical protein